MALTVERRDLRDAVRGLIAKTSSGQGQPSTTGADRSPWRRLCDEIGVAGLAIPERYGGAGAGLAEVCVVMEELGRNLTPSPMLGSAVFAAQAVLASGDDAACRAAAARDRRRLVDRRPRLDHVGRALGRRRARLRRPRSSRKWLVVAAPVVARWLATGSWTARRTTCWTAMRPTCCWSPPERPTAPACSRSTRARAASTRARRRHHGRKPQPGRGAADRRRRPSHRRGRGQAAGVRPGPGVHRAQRRAGGRVRAGA